MKYLKKCIDMLREKKKIGFIKYRIFNGLVWVKPQSQWKEIKWKLKQSRKDSKAKRKSWAREMLIGHSACLGDMKTEFQILSQHRHKFQAGIMASGGPSAGRWI